MKQAADGIPGTFHLAWMLLMRPVHLHRRLKAAGIDNFVPPIWDVWRCGKSAGEARCLYALRLYLITNIVVVSAFFLIGTDLPLDMILVLLALFVGVAVSIVDYLPVRIMFCLLLGVGVGYIGDMNDGIAVGIVLGLVVSAWNALIHGAPDSLSVGVVLGSVLCLGSIAGDSIAGDIEGSVYAGASLSVAFYIALFHLFLYPFEFIVQVFILDWENDGRPSLDLAPVLHHDLSYLPHPLLERHILRAAERDQAVARRTIEACAIAPGQRQIGKRTLVRLQARELTVIAQDFRFARASELRGEWLPGVEGADKTMLAFRDAAGYLLAATTAGIPHHRMGYANRAAEVLTSVSYLLKDEPRWRAGPLTAALEEWQTVCNEIIDAAAEAAADQIPQVFRANEPLEPDRGGELFRGRELLARAVEALLADPDHSASIALLGPRRCGKTSLLKMLPQMLPDAVCVFFDVQDNPVDSPAAFFQALDARVRDGARRDRRLNLPRLDIVGPPFESATRWFNALEEAAGNHRILLCIDEFERLEDLWPGDRSELLRLMGLFRATIQHRRKLRLLVSGVARFDELGAMWDDHFINVREIRVGPLDRSASVDLLSRPVPEFPERAIAEPVAAAVYDRTGGQPFLLQLYGSLLVTRLNESRRTQADAEDVAAVEDQVLAQAGSFFRDALRAAPNEVHAALKVLEADSFLPIGDPTRHWLHRRGLLTDDGKLSIPVLGAWARAEL